jgi:hypothetical protein
MSTLTPHSSAKTCHGACEVCRFGLQAMKRFWGTGTKADTQSPGENITVTTWHWLSWRKNGPVMILNSMDMTEIHGRRDLKMAAKVGRSSKWLMRRGGGSRLFLNDANGTRRCPPLPKRHVLTGFWTKGMFRPFLA